MRRSNQENFLIAGFGFEGRCAFNYLRSKYPQAEISIADKQKAADAPPGIDFYHGSGYLAKAGNFQTIIKSPGIPADLPELKAAEKSGSIITTATNLFFEKYRNQIIGVTATKGKSTVASLIYEILKISGKDAYLLGNIGGRDPFRFLTETKSQQALFVYELSSYQLADIKQGPHIAVFMTIFPDHLPYHGNFKKYRQAKANIVLSQTSRDIFVFNSSYDFIKALAKKTPAKTVDYVKKCRIQAGRIFYGKEKIIDAADVKLLGVHNLENIFACICVAKQLKLKNKHIQKAVASFKGLPHRLEFVKSVNGVDFYDDAISTTPESTMAAMQVFKSRLCTMILGGQDRGYNFKKLARKIYELKINNIVLFPDSGDRIWQEILKIYNKKNKPLPLRIKARNMKQAVAFASKNTLPGQVCLLSTASPSYGMFKNFMEKGDLFKEIVRGIK